MLVQMLPDTMTKLALMGDVAAYEPAGDQPQQEHRHVPYQSHSLAECITSFCFRIHYNTSRLDRNRSGLQNPTVSVLVVSPTTS
jgi:hypothetical protein